MVQRQTFCLALEKRKTEISQFYSLFRLLKDAWRTPAEGSKITFYNGLTL